MIENYANEKQAGMYMVVVDVDTFPLTFDSEGGYKITHDTYSQLVKVTDFNKFNEHLQDLCKTPGARVSYYFLSKFENVLEF